MSSIKGLSSKDKVRFNFEENIFELEHDRLKIIYIWTSYGGYNSGKKLQIDSYFNEEHIIFDCGTLTINDTVIIDKGTLVFDPKIKVTKCPKNWNRIWVKLTDGDVSTLKSLNKKRANLEAEYFKAYGFIRERETKSILDSRQW
jgi:hypothetical protein